MEIIVTNGQLIKDAKEWLASKTNEEWAKLIEEQDNKINSGGLNGNNI